MDTPDSVAPGNASPTVGNASGGVRSGVITAGTWTLDRIKLIDQWPQQEHLATIESVSEQGGGSAHNLAMALRHLDPELPVFTSGLVGNDADGEKLRLWARAAGIVGDGLRCCDAASTSYTDVITDIGTGKRTFFHHRGCSDLLAAADIDLSSCRAQILHLGLVGVHALLDAAVSQPHPVTDSPGSAANGWFTVLQHARQCGLLTNLELVSIEAERLQRLVQPCLAVLDSLVVNEFELGAVAGVSTLSGGKVDRPACREAMRHIWERASLQQLVLHYPGGAMGLTPGSELLDVPSVQVPEDQIKGSVGAGDAFAAGVLYGWHQGWSLEARIRLGHATAAASLHASDSISAIGTLDECQRLAADYGWRDEG